MTLPDSDRDTGARRPGPSGSRVSGSVVVLLLLVLAAIAVGVWLWLLEDDESAGPEAGVTVEDVAEDRFADFLIGEEVTISGEITAWLVPGRAFWIGGDDIGDENVLIVTEGPVEVLDDGVVVQATGVVADFEEVPLLEALDPEQEEILPDFGPYEDQNVLADADVVVLGGA